MRNYVGRNFKHISPRFGKHVLHISLPCFNIKGLNAGKAGLFFVG